MAGHHPATEEMPGRQCDIFSLTFFSILFEKKNLIFFFASVEIHMKDVESTESKEKSNF